MASRLMILLAGLALVLSPAAAQAQPHPIGEVQARARLEKLLPEVFEKAQTYLLAQQRRDGSFAGDPFGNAFVTLSLLETGLSAKNPALQRAVDYLLKVRNNETTFLALRLEVLVRVRAQMAASARGPLDERISADLKDLLEAQMANGAFRSSPTSNSQPNPPCELTFEAFKALRFCTDQGFKVPEAALKKTVAMYVAFQNSNGGWSNSTKGKDLDGSDGYLTLRAAAGLAAFGQDQSCREGGAKSDQAIAEAARESAKYLRENTWGWCRWAAKGNDPRDFWFYRQVSLVGGFLHAMPLTRFDEGGVVEDFCLPLVARQGPEKDGHWNGPVETAFALHPLAYEARPILICELVETEAPLVGNRGLLAATERLSLAERPVAVRYDRGRIGADYPLWEKTPLAFLDATDKFKLADDEKKNLRDYVTGGGTLVVQIHCGKKEAFEAVTRELQSLWPALAVQPLRPNHPVWTADGLVSTSSRPGVLGLDDGVRTFGFIFQKNLIGDFAGGGEPTSLQLFRSVTAYALEGDWNFKPLEPPAPAAVATSAAPATPAAAAAPRPGEARTVAVAQIVPSASAPPPGYNGFSPAAEPVTRAAPKFKLLGPKPLVATDEHLAVCDLAWLSVTTSSTLGEAELAALKKYVAGGGFLVLEARLGDEANDKSARTMAEALGLQIEPAKGSALATGEFGGEARGYDVSKTSPRKGGKLSAATETDLRLLTLGGKTVGVYSPLDLNISASGIRCWGLHGYSAREAREILANILISRTVK